MPEEFSPKDQITRSLQLWWLIALAIILGGLIGFAFHHLHSPVYQAKAIISTYIDYQAVSDVMLSEYDEDITINSIENVLLSNDVIGSVLQAAGKDGISLDYATFMKKNTVSRKLADFEIFYVDSDPASAQRIVNLWVQTAMETIHRMQANGNLPAYLVVNLSATAELPQTPYYAQTNSYVLAGAVFGLVTGILLSTLPIKRKATFHNDHGSRQGGRKA